jgi:hypothetical protein
MVIVCSLIGVEWGRGANASSKRVLSTTNAHCEKGSSVMANGTNRENVALSAATVAFDKLMKAKSGKLYYFLITDSSHSNRS